MIILDQIFKKVKELRSIKVDVTYMASLELSGIFKQGESNLCR